MARFYVLSPRDTKFLVKVHDRLTTIVDAIKQEQLLNPKVVKSKKNKKEEK